MSSSVSSGSVDSTLSASPTAVKSSAQAADPENKVGSAGGTGETTGARASAPAQVQAANPPSSSPAAVKPAAVVPAKPVVASPSPSSTSSAASPAAVVKPALPATPAGGLAAAVNASMGQQIRIPAGLKGVNTNDLGNGFFHGMVYSETSARKSSTAAKFGTPDEVLIVLCRQPEQLIPLRGMGYRVLHAENAEALQFALTYPEAAAEHLLAWPEWAKHPNRTLVLDDVTEAVALLLEANQVSDTGKEFKDMRKVYGEAGKDLRGLIKSLRRKPMNLILIALAKVTQTPLTNEERIAPDLPPSMSGMLTTELEFVFFIKKSNWKMITDSVFITYKDIDEKTGKEAMYRREIFAKYKLPMNLAGKGLVKLEEELDIHGLWKRIKEASAATKK